MERIRHIIRQLKSNNFISFLKQMNVMKLVRRIIYLNYPFYLYIILLFSGILLYIYLLAPTPSTVIVIDARSRAIQFTIVNPVAARVYFDMPVLVKRSIRDKGMCLTGLLEPKADTIAKYKIFSNVLVIRYVSDDKVTAQFKAQGSGPPIELNSASSISYGNTCGEADSRERHAVRLPIWGPAVLGEVVTPATGVNRINDHGGLLLEGAVQIFGRSISMPIIPEQRSKLYVAGEFRLPPGARLAAERGAAGKGASWWGFALFDPSNDAHGMRALEVAASTEAERLVLNRMGSQRDGEVLEVGFFVQIFRDPLLLKVQLLIVGVFGTFQLAHILKDFIGKDDK